MEELKRNEPNSQSEGNSSDDLYSEVPSWFYFLSHHEIDELDHCICIDKKNSRLPFAFCARCSGSVIGFVISLILLSFSLNFSELILDIIAFIFPLPAIIDWGTQSIGKRKSKNIIRILTGILYGYAVLPTTHSLLSKVMDFSILFMKPLMAFLIYFVLVTIITKKKMEYRFRNK
ncbi:MAG: DUF2085 domain-containing protein [Candidatus Ranarchaeia archaeon]